MHRQSLMRATDSSWTGGPWTCEHDIGVPWGFIHICVDIGAGTPAWAADCMLTVAWPQLAEAWCG